MVLILMQYGMHTLEHIMGCVREESLDGDDRAGTLWSLMEMQRWRCLGGTHFGMGLSLLDLATFDDAWRMSLLAYK